MIGHMMLTVTITGKEYQDPIMKGRISGGMKQVIQCVIGFRHPTIGWNQYMTVTGMTGSRDYIPIAGMITAVMGMGIFGIAAGV
ncbi:MAG: hypothetical protein AB9858_04150 [Acidaminococcaceae bacterium]